MQFLFEKFVSFLAIVSELDFQVISPHRNFKGCLSLGLGLLSSRFMKIVGERQMRRIHITIYLFVSRFVTLSQRVCEHLTQTVYFLVEL